MGPYFSPRLKIPEAILAPYRFRLPALALGCLVVTNLELTEHSRLLGNVSRKVLHVSNYTAYCLPGCLVTGKKSMSNIHQVPKEMYRGTSFLLRTN